MKTINFDKLYTDFQKFFSICHYNNQALKEEIFKKLNGLEEQNDVLVFSFRQVIFKFQIDNDSIKYTGYEK